MQEYIYGLFKSVLCLVLFSRRIRRLFLCKEDANKKYNFEDKFAALLSNPTHSVTREIKDGFVSAPKGCYIQLEKKASKYILDNSLRSLQD